jgi:dehydrodolichyl diphosphate syntase complex subunit NUS1
MGLTENESVAFHRNTTATGKDLDAQDREKLLKRLLPDPRSDDMSVPQKVPQKASQQSTYKPQPYPKKAIQKATTSNAARKQKAIARARAKPIRNLIKNQLSILLFTLIQFFFGLYVRSRIAYHGVSERILAILYYHHRTPELIRKDVRHLSKLPQHLSVVLTLSPEDANSTGLEKLLNDVAEISAWCASAGIPALSIYERTGILKRYIPHTHHAVNRTLQAYFGDAFYSKRPTVSIRSPNQSTFSPPNTPPELSDAATPTEDVQHPQHLSILLLSAEDGRSTLVDLTKTLAEMAQKSKLEPEDISTELIDAEISESVMGEPELLLVFGPKIVLEGYPPWQVRLTEIFCVKDNLEGVGYQVFLRALCNFAKAQMRFGR